MLLSIGHTLIFPLYPSFTRCIICVYITKWPKKNSSREPCVPVKFPKQIDRSSATVTRQSSGNVADGHKPEPTTRAPESASPRSTTLSPFTATNHPGEAHPPMRDHAAASSPTARVVTPPRSKHFSATTNGNAETAATTGAVATPAAAGGGTRNRNNSPCVDVGSVAKATRGWDGDAPEVALGMRHYPRKKSMMSTFVGGGDKEDEELVVCAGARRKEQKVKTWSRKVVFRHSLHWLFYS